ncbi:MAG: YceI family protein [Bacteroidota bacterium]
MRLLLTLILSACLLQPTFSQKDLTLLGNSEVTVDGTSTVSDWTVTVGDKLGRLIVSDDFSARPAEGESLVGGRLVCVVKSMDGGRGETMNDKIYAAFDQGSHPHITFDLTGGKVSAQTEKGFTLQTSGTLAMAGKEQAIELELEGESLPGGGYRLFGDHTFNMTAFGIEPPTAFFGSLEVADPVTVKFNLLFK